MVIGAALLVADKETRGIKTPLSVDTTSSIAEASATAPVALIPMFCADNCPETTIEIAANKVLLTEYFITSWDKDVNLMCLLPKYKYLANAVCQHSWHFQHKFSTILHIVKSIFVRIVSVLLKKEDI